MALALGGLYHGYRQLRNRKVNEALIQGDEAEEDALLERATEKAVADDWLLLLAEAVNAAIALLKAVEDACLTMTNQ